jgi:hypothetical protein
MKKSFAGKIQFCFCLIIIMLNFAVLTSVIAQEKNPPAATKYDSLRLENEITFDIPLEQAEPVWQWMQSHFKTAWQSKSEKFDTFTEIEQFTDTYYDTPEHSLINRSIGLRHRRRFYPDGEIKELIQLKQPYDSNEKDQQTRGELKFELKTASVSFDQGEHDYLNNNLLQIVKNVQRPLLIERLKNLNVNARRLRPALSLRQERRRIYFRQNGNQFFTLTLDLASAKKLWVKGRFAQLDIEIGEIAFTEASEVKRQQFLEIQQELQNLLINKFPNIKRNQTPKIVQMFKVIRAQGLISSIILRFGASVLLFVGIVILGLVLCFGSKTRKKHYAPL